MTPAHFPFYTPVEAHLLRAVSAWLSPQRRKIVAQAVESKQMDRNMARLRLVRPGRATASRAPQ